MRRDGPNQSRWPQLAALGIAGAALWWWLPREAPRTTVAPEEERPPPPAPPLGAPRGRPEWTIDLRLADRAALSGAVRDTQGRPIVGAQVCASAQSDRLASSDRRRAICGLSGRDGRYRLEGLFGVRHQVSAGAAGFIPAAYFRGEGAARRETVDLRPGMEARDIDITLAGGGVEIRGVVKDLSGGAIEGAQVAAEHAVAFSDDGGAFSLWVRPGEVWMEAQADGYAPGHESGAAPGHVFELFLTPEAVLVGKVVRAGDGTPIEGAQVSSESSGRGWGSGTAITDAAGVFRIDGLEPGVYKPRAEADDAMGLAEEQVILGLGETSEPVVITAHPAFFIEGRVVVAGGASCDVGSVNLQDRANARGAWARCEPDGTARLRGLAPGEYEVSVRCEGHVPAERYERVVVAERSASGLKWEVTRGQSIRGVVVDDGGRPVARVNVNAEARPDPGRPRAHQTSTWGGETDASGRFELAGLLPGIYSLNVSSWQEPRATPPKPIEATLSEGQDLEGVRIELPATGEVRGVVRDAKGRPVAKLEIRLSDGVKWYNTPAADDGAFHFAHVAAGEYRVTAGRGWGESMRAPGTSDDDIQGEKVSLRAGQTASVKLVVDEASGALSGVVRDAGGGPVADAFVEATRESDSAAQAAGGALRRGRWGSFSKTPHLTEPDGRFSLTDLPAGKYTVRAHRKGGGEAIREHVELGGEVELTIAETGRMSGTVDMRGGGTPEEFRVSLSDEATGFYRGDSFLRTNGAWSFPELPAGEYKVRVSAGPGTAEVEASMRAGEDTTGVRVELAPKVTVRGQVVDLDGEPVAGMHVSVGGSGAWSSGDEQKLNITDEQGRFELAHVPTGLVRITVRPRSWRDSEYERASVPARLDDAASVIELPPIQVVKKRVHEGEASGDLGYTIQEPEPGADPLARRLVVAVVRPGSPAAAAGLQVGDEIVSVDGHDVTGPRAALHMSLTRALPGTNITLGLARGVSVRLVVGKRP